MSVTALVMIFFYHSDEDECMAGTHNCHNDSYCINMDDTYTCACKEGFMGNGTYCQGENSVASLSKPFYNYIFSQAFKELRKLHTTLKRFALA